MPDPAQQQLAETVRTACIQAALAAYEEGGILGLCAEGRWEYAISALQQLDVEALVQDAAAPAVPAPPGALIAEHLR